MNYLKDKRHQSSNNNKPHYRVVCAEIFKNLRNQIGNVNCHCKIFLILSTKKAYYRDTLLLNNDITHSEVIEAICKLKNKKVMGQLMFLMN